MTLYGVHFLVVFPLCMNYALNIWRVYYIQKMAEQNGDGYIKCAGCKCKYNNDGDSIQTHFGYNRLKEQLKTCVKCRNRSKQYHQDNFEKRAQKQHQFWIDNKDTINAQRQELIRTALKATVQLNTATDATIINPLMTLYVQMANHLTRVIRA